MIRYNSDKEISKKLSEILTEYQFNNDKSPKGAVLIRIKEIR